MATATKKTEAEQLREQYPNAWIPIEEGDTLDGTVADITRAWSDARNKGTGDGWYPLYNVQTQEGSILAWHAFSAVSYNEAMEKQPLPGERITITYTGLGKAKPGQNAPKLFKLIVHGRDPRAAAAAVYGRLGDGHVLAQARQERAALDTAAQSVQDTFAGTQEELPY